MIAGNGIDIIEIDRIAAASRNSRFNNRVFTPGELQESKELPQHLAGCFAAKEALLKSLGTGLAGFSWLEMEVHHDERGAPYFQVSGKIRSYLEKTGITRIHLSISHSQLYAIAQVILETEDRHEGCTSGTDAGH
ncbi:MAG TPA: holo-ACP synthase [Bacillota bacterium]